MPQPNLHFYIEYFSNLGVAAEEIERLLPELKHIRVEASEVLLRQGEQQKYGYLIASGLLKACYFSANGSERCKEYYFQGELCFLYSSWLTGTPANYQIDAVKTSSVLRVPLSLLTSPSWQRAKLTLLQQQLLYKEDKEAFLLLQTPEQRYLHLLQHAPNWIEELNDIQLAAYIGITPISLSRIKTRVKSLT